MAYLGGKSKNAQHIIDVLNDPLFDGMDYIEPFLGYGHILRRVKNKNSYSAYDGNPLLITLLKSIQNECEIPMITKQRYYELKLNPKNNLETAVACFTHSYNGKPWGGYVFDNTNTASYKKSGKYMNYREQRLNYYKKLQQNEIFMNTEIQCSSFEKLNPTNSIIYCDPPYEKTTGYGCSFNHTLFWETMRKWSEFNIVFISEYNAPDDFVKIAESKKRVTLHPAKKTYQSENLYVWNQSVIFN